MASVELDGEAVLYDERTERVHVLNPTASLVWSCLDGATLEDIIRDIAEAFGADESMVASDVLDLVAEFDRQQLLAGMDDDG